MERKFHSYRELKKDPEAHEYRDTLAKALKLANTFTGTEKAYKELMDALECLQEVIQTSPSITGTNPIEYEANAALLFAPQYPRDINDLLEIASASLEKTITKALEGSASSENGFDEELALHIRSISGIFLPPEKTNTLKEKGEGSLQRIDVFKPRLQEFINILREMNIFTDDILITIGDVRPEMMRQKSYAVIEIPRLQKTLLICDQYGEATFVIHKLVPAREFLTLKKTELIEKFGEDRVTKIIFSDFWKENIKRAILSEKESNRPSKKIDIGAYEQDQVREAIQSQITPDQWLSLDQKERNAYRINGLNLLTLSKIFKTPRNEGSSLTVKNYLKLGKAIFGANEQKIHHALEREERGKDEWRALVLEKYPRSEDWIAMTAPERREMAFDGWKLTFIKNLFGIEGNPLGRNIDYLELGLRIYGENDPLLLKALEKARLRENAEKQTPQEWRDCILERYPQAQDWLNTIKGKGSDININGVGRKTLLNIFGIPAASPRVSLLELGKRIYGENDPVILEAIKRDA